MARIRTVKPEFWASEQVMECSPIARLLFIGLWNFCDDAGNHALSCKTIKAQVFPGDDIDSETIQHMLDELSSNGLLAYYTHENKDFLHVTGWHHQKIEKPSFKHPPCRPEDLEHSRQMVVDYQPPEGSLKEPIGEEGNTGGDTSPSTSESNDSQTLVSAYHRLLPHCKRIAVLNPKRKRRIVAAVKLARNLCREQGWNYDADQFWGAYFGECTKDSWLRGEVANPKNPSWRQNLDVLLDEDRFATIMDSAIDSLRGEA